jgi:hypothetical protein
MFRAAAVEPGKQGPSVQSWRRPVRGRAGISLVSGRAETKVWVTGHGRSAVQRALCHRRTGSATPRSSHCA